MNTEDFYEVRQMKDKTTIGRFIQLKRKENGLSQRELAERLYVTESAVSKWERGVSYPDITMISGICEALNISEHELCTASEDTRQHELEKMAEKYSRFRLIYNLILAFGYIATIIPCFIIFVVKEHSPSKFFILLTSLMLTASLLNVPVIAEKHKGLLTLGSFWVSLNLLLLSGCVYSGGDWFIMAFISVLMGFAIVFLPFVLRSEPIAPYMGKNKGLICLAADTLLILAEISYGTLNYGNTYDFRSGILSALWCLLLAWIIFAVIRYLKINMLFKAAICIASAAGWVFISNPLMELLIDGKMFILNAADNRYNTAVSLVMFGIAAVFAAAGEIFKRLRIKD